MKFSIDYYEIMYEDPSLMVCSAYIVSEGTNLHDTYFSLESIEKSIPSLANKPIVAVYDEYSEDFEDHARSDYEKSIRENIGNIPESCKAEIVDYNGKKFLKANFIVWKKYSENAANRLKNNPNVKISMEIDVYKTSEMEDGIKSIDEFSYNAISLLGDDKTSAIPNANAEVIKYSYDERVEEYALLYSKVKEDLEESGNKEDEDDVDDFSIPEKYKSINFKPTEKMAKNAQSGLDMRDEQPKSNKCCTPTGLRRANQLVQRQELSPSIVKRMKSFFDRHEVDKDSESWKEGNSKGEQAWLLWGGDAGYAWSKKVVKQMEKADEKGEYSMSEFSKEDIGSGEALKISLTKKSADFETDWGNVDKTKLRNEIMKASNYKTLVKKAYLVVEDGWEDAPSQHLKYPVVMIKDGKVIYSSKGVQSALSFLEKEGDASYYKVAKSKLKSIYEKLGLSTENFSMEVYSLDFIDVMRVLEKKLMEEKGKNEYGYPNMYLHGCDGSYVYGCDYSTSPEKYFMMPYSEEGESYMIDYENSCEVFPVTKYVKMEEKEEDMMAYSIGLADMFETSKGKIVELTDELATASTKITEAQEEITNYSAEIEELKVYKEGKEKEELKSKAEEVYSKYEGLLSEEEINEFNELLFSVEFKDFEGQVALAVLPKALAKANETVVEEKDKDAIDINFSNLQPEKETVVDMSKMTTAERLAYVMNK